MAYAIVRTGGKQFRVSEGDIVHVPSITAEVGDSVKLETLLEGDGQSVELGGGEITATVVEHGRAPKIIVF
ncbi:MAG TPA: 50S ribosomal protein L21, partial [Blastocatellia bacterium]|nr:50S ribosomal protein L21 [Blastocatellia bacterium]